MAEYKLTHDVNMVYRRVDGAFIPLGTDSSDCAAYVKWVADGGIPDPDQTLAEAKTSRINLMRGKARVEIETNYPVYKQFNINEKQKHSDGDKTTMWSFINARRDKCDAKEVLINACTTAEQVNAILWKD